MHWTRSLFDTLFSGYVSTDELRQTHRMSSRRHERKVRDLEEQIDELEDWLGELALLNQTMLKLLLDRQVVEPAALKQTLREIDLLDGVEDGRVTPPETAKKLPEKKKKSSGRKKSRRRGKGA